MCWKVILFQTTLITLLIRLSSSLQKRSPLEIGYVQFTTLHHPHLPHLQHLPLHEVTIHLPPVVVHSNSSKPPTHALQYREHWVPGHVENHVFVPGRVQHVLVPSALVVLHPVVHHMEYRKHYGGFGVGVDFGGRGAGHGFHVL